MKKICLVLLLIGFITSCAPSQPLETETYDGQVIGLGDIVFANKLSSSAILGTAIYMDNENVICVQGIVHLDIGQRYVITVRKIRPIRSNSSPTIYYDSIITSIRKM